MNQSNKKGRLIGFGFGTPSCRETVMAADFPTREEFLSNRRYAKKYGYNVRDIHGRKKAGKARKGTNC